MRYEPYENEYAAVPDMSESDLLEYFLLRVFETEEIWGLKEVAYQWLTREQNGRLTQPVWPYKRYADEAAVDDWEYCIPVAESLEFFMERSLPKLVEDKVLLEIMPRKNDTSCLIEAQRLFNILDGMIDAGTYTMDAV